MSTTIPIQEQAVPGRFLRLGADPQELTDSLGPLAHLLGTWCSSHGWNIIAVPQGEKGFQLLIRPYLEIITFTPIGAPVPNRGGTETQLLPALRYDLRISDAITNQPLHIENGMWLLLNKRQDPQVLSVARQATVPHGVSTLALGSYSITSEPPQIPNNTAVPNPGKGMPLGYLDPYLNPPPGVNPTNPNKNLQDVVKDQTIVETVALSVSTASGGGIADIPFLVEHANATQFTATYWIEKVQDKATGAEFEQLQYSQQTDIHFLPRFDDPDQLIMWPHINVNTLLKQ